MSFRGGWNYRVFKRELSDGAGGTETEFFIGEAYYNNEGSIVACTEAVSPLGGSRDELIESLLAYVCAVDRPIIDYDWIAAQQF